MTGILVAMDPVKELNHEIYDLLVDLSTVPAPALRTWDGDTWGQPEASATLVLNHPSALRVMLMPPSDLVAGEAYAFNDIDIEGDIYGALNFAADLQKARRHPVKAMKLMRRLRRLPEAPGHAEKRPVGGGRLHSKSRDSEAVRAHYDTGNEFFGTFLDPQMVYSCAYFLDAGEPLEIAQKRKLDLVCRKLQLAPGQRMLDVGCGWGALAVHAALDYDVEVLGITLSTEQAGEARIRAKEAGVEDRVRIEVLDYRDVEGPFDAISSIGMFEHVGHKELGAYFRHLFKTLGPRGILLNHGITTRDRKPGRHRPTFVSTYVFPDGELAPFEQSLQEAEGAGFWVRDIESLRPSYALTLRTWVKNLEANHAHDPAGSDVIYRIWRAYMAAAAMAFEEGGIDVYQLVAVKPDRPWTLGRSFMIASDDR